MSYYLVFSTVGNIKEAKSIVRKIVELQLAACVNIITNVESTYWWQGKIEASKEVLLLIKTNKPNLNNLIRKIKQLHSYTVPEIVAVPIIKGNPVYLKWINESVTRKEKK